MNNHLSVFNENFQKRWKKQYDQECLPVHPYHKGRKSVYKEMYKEISWV